MRLFGRRRIPSGVSVGDFNRAVVQEQGHVSSKRAGKSRDFEKACRTTICIVRYTVMVSGHHNRAVAFLCSLAVPEGHPALVTRYLNWFFHILCHDCLDHRDNWNDGSSFL